MVLMFNLFLLHLLPLSTALPVILEGPKDIQVKIGSSAIFKCRSSLPASKVFWTHDGAEVFSTVGRSTLEQQALYQSTQILDDGTLIIQNVASSSGGVYTCTLVDEVGGSTVSRPALLTVQERTEKPRIAHRPIKTVVSVGDKIVLDCLAMGYPPPVYTWYKDGGRLSNAHDRFSLAGNGSLIIENAQLDDSAHYRCSASNYLGKATSSARVQVETSDPPSAPRITTKPRNKTVPEGGIIELTCVAEGSPYPSITWWNNRRLVTGGARVTISNGGQHLRIQDIEVYDQGDYTCVAENYLGKEQIVSILSVIPESNPSRREGATRSGATPLSPGGYSSTGYRTWHPGHLDGPATHQVGHGRQDGPASLDPMNIKYRPDLRTNRLDFSANRTNRLDSSTSLPTDEGTLGFEYRGIDTMKATTGSTIQLQCKIQNSRSGVKWEKDGGPLQRSTHRVGSDGSIILYNIEARDAGEYACMDSTNRERRMVAQVLVIEEQSFTSRSTRAREPGPSGRSPVSPVAPSASRPPSAVSASEQQSTASALRYPGLQASSNTLSKSGELPPAIRVGQDFTFAETIGFPPESAGEEEEGEEEEQRHSTDLSYDVGGVADQFVLISLEEAKRTVDRALNHTVELLFTFQQHTNRTPHQLLSIFRYPSGTDRELARAAEIYHRTLDLVERKVKEGNQYNLTTFSIEHLISPANIELIGNLSGCEAHRRHVDCEDVCFQTKYRSADGSCNNWANPLWGSSLTPFLRLLNPQYENGFNTPIGFTPGKLYNGHPKPSARKVSTYILSTKKVTMDSQLTSMVMQWGQFLDHDLGHSMESVSRETFGTGHTCSGTCENEPPCFPITIPEDDERIRSQSCMEFTRSAASCGSGTTSVFFEKLQMREQVNQLTSFIDASQVYGSERTLAANLRNLTNSFGRLREGVTYDHGKPLLPFNDGHPVDCRRDPRESDIGCFLTGDVRANEQLGLIAMHTIWFREHNRIAEHLREMNPHWEGETLYEESRKLVGAAMQHITYKHWLPLILGEEGMDILGVYKGYEAGLNPSVSNIFTTAAFRFGHTLISPVMFRLNADFTTIPEGNLSLHEAFFAPWRLVEEGGIDPLLRGLFYHPAKMPRPSQSMHSELTEKLFQVAHTVALDLAALNIQRGRDHALPPYTQWVEHCGLGIIGTWQDLKLLIKDEGVVKKLKELYGHPGNIDVFVGGVLEDLVERGRVGPTFRCILLDQFRRLRDGDRFWYERSGIFTPDQLSQINQITLGSVVCNNADDIRVVAKNVFLVEGQRGLVNCAHLHTFSFLPWKECVKDDHHGARIQRDVERDEQSLKLGSLDRLEVRLRRLEEFEVKLGSLEELESRLARLENLEHTIHRLQGRLEKLVIHVFTGETRRRLPVRNNMY